MRMFTFLLVNFNMSGIVDQCIQGIEKQLVNETDYEIIVADNSTDPTFRLTSDYCSQHPQVRLIPLAQNRGWVDALNQIIPEATGEFVVVMHPDVQMDPGCLETLRAFMDAHPGAAVVSPNLYYPDGSENAIRLRFPTIGVEVRRLINMLSHIAFKRTLIRDEPLWDHREDVQVDMVMSVCMLFRRSVLQAIGAVEPRLVTYYSNDYLSGRARQIGCTCHYVAAARAIHYERYSDKKLYSSRGDSAYKSSPIPAAARMEKDRFTFLQQFYSGPEVFGFRVLALLEYAIQLTACLKRPVEQRAQMGRQIWAAVRAICEPSVSSR